LKSEEKKIKSYLKELNKKIKNFRERAAKMMKGTHKLKALYPGLYQVFCITDKSFEVNGKNFYQKLEESRNKTNKKYSLYAINTNKKVSLLTKNRSMNINILEESIPEKKRASLANSKNLDKSNDIKLFPKIISKPNKNYLLDDDSKTPPFNNSVKTSLISKSGSGNKVNDTLSNEINKKMDFNKNEKLGSINTSLLINNKKILTNLTSKSIFQNVKPLNLTLNDKENDSTKKKLNEILTYAQLIEKTGKFNIIPDINKNPLYNKFQQKLDQVLGDNQKSTKKNDFKALSIRSSIFNLKIENSTNRSDVKESSRVKLSNIPNKSSQKLDSININLKNSFSSSKFSDNSLVSSFHINVIPQKNESSEHKFDLSLDCQNQLIELLKKENIYWERLVKENEILGIIERFEVHKCEQLFLHLVLIFETDLSNMVPRFFHMIKKIKGYEKGKTKQSQSNMKEERS
jgi:hypothetical protein